MRRAVAELKWHSSPVLCELLHPSSTARFTVKYFRNQRLCLVRVLLASAHPPACWFYCVLFLDLDIRSNSLPQTTKLLLTGCFNGPFAKITIQKTYAFIFQPLFFSYYSWVAVMKDQIFPVTSKTNSTYHMTNSTPHRHPTPLF
ncbi:uncharacterized protein BDZ99DRAFT_200090 [Mytilinidion resinicola]|uniref:Uncharacterized protein n=1 Tax=Mytilinidion resinicola TaxID=574789 RepID=A0A6A6Y2R3_9PEZI|nr:uncharacterized protein BDZ99DRAFT_200090 [Mytilinidion resinicola]KAF2802808.1 hypothetical protein BDZ99DRAFT_200090 [Mytilinidion resinicola]